MRLPILPAAFAAAIGLVAMPALAADTFTYSYNGYTAELPVEPQRVVVLDNRLGIEFSVLAGFPIVSVGLGTETASPLEPFLPDGVARSSDVEPNRERVLALDADLVVVDRGMWEWYQTDGLFDGTGFNVLVLEGTGAADWKDKLRGQLAAYNRADKADAAIAEYDATVGALKPEMERILAGRKVAIGGALEEQFWLQVGSFNTSIAADMGIATVVGDAPTDGTYQFYSAETLAPFADAALLFMQSGNEDYRSNPLYQRLPAAEKTVKINWLTVYGFSIAAQAFANDLAAAVKTID